ncbi:class I SAM-dependent methyltransferase [Nitriliruptor alkaliphilus]|uniref:class I SAM-dependent methyltransferase n=1 Tax=Nitriliruptor alkaliphilus TaxID=427918 RepID=UPI0006961D90|nr:methyltransferase domain-containing protein [Nitriliruptor alkaliphilus]
MSPTTATHGWQLVDDSAVAYEEYLVPLVFDAAARDLLDRVGVTSGQRVLDIACGTGVVARYAERLVGSSGEVTAVDVNPGMLAVARRAAGAAPITWEQASAAALPLPDASVDVVCCQQGLQFLADRRRALAEVHRVTVPGGRIGVSVCRGLEHQPGYLELVAALRQHVGRPAADGMASPFDAGSRTDLRQLLLDAGFDEVEVRIVIWPLRLGSAAAFLRGEVASSPLADLFAELDADVIDALVADLTLRLEPHTDDAGLTFPLETLVATATRT